MTVTIVGTVIIASSTKGTSRPGLEKASGLR